MDEFCRACKEGNLLKVKSMVESGYDVNKKYEKDHGLYETPLLYAAVKGRFDVVKYLINHGADISKTNDRKQTALHYASKYGHLKVVELLLSKGAGIDVEDKWCQTPLILSTNWGHSDISLHLINHGADFNKTNVHKRTALHYASEYGHLKVVELLLSKGAGIDVEDEDGRTPLMLAAKRGRSDILSYLIDHGVDLNKTNVHKRTALHYASDYGHLKVVELLLSKDAGIDVEDEDGHTPLTLAAKGGRNDILLYLIDHGLDLNKTNVHKRTALHYASEFGYLKVVELLLSKGAGIDVEDKDRCSPLMLAATKHHFNIVYHLITAGASVKQLADYDYSSLGKDVLSYGIENNHIAAAKVLITNNVGIEGELHIYPRRTALMLCAENGHDSLVRLLILQGVDVDYQGANGDTALHFAARSKHIQCGILLVEAGASVRRRNKASVTPLAVASREFKDAVMQTLSFNTRKTVCVIGNAYSGKSTLIASLQNESANLLTKIRHRLFGVKNISARTAGIEPVSLSSKRYGDVVFFDFAGQHEYHGPHEMFLESILSKSRSTLTIIVVVKVTEKESAISQQLDQWLHIASKMSPSTNPIRVIVIGSHMDKVESKVAAKEKLERCYGRVRQSLCDVPLEFNDACYLDCRQPYYGDIERLCAYLNEVPLPEYKATKMPYSICWVVSQMNTSLDSKAIRVEDFTEWIKGNKANLPTNLPPAEEVCKDLSSTGHFLYLPNKEEPSNGWLVLDLPSILHEVYGTLFSPSKKIVNKFGLLSCRKFSVLFNTLNQGMIRNILISLEFCIEVDPSILAEEFTQLTESTDKDHEHLFFPALISTQPPKVFTCTQEGCHVLSWQLVVDRKPFISPRLLQTIILRLAAHHVIHYKQGPDTREHYCSVWSTGIFWQSIDGYDVAVQITDNAVVEVIGRSEVGPEVLCSYVSTITQDIFATIRELSPTLSATAYIIHPADPQVLLENPRSPSPQEMFPVEIILTSTRNGGKFCLSRMAENKPALKPFITEVFCGFEPSEEVLQSLYSCIVPPSVVSDTEQVTTTCVDPHPGLTTPPETSEATADTKTPDTALYDQPLHRAQEFDSEAFMDKFKDRFLQSVDSHAIVRRLEIEKVISKELSHNIKKQYVDGGNEELFLYLQKNTSPEGFRKLCDVMMTKAGYDNMVELGQDMKKDLDLLTNPKPTHLPVEMPVEPSSITSTDHLKTTSTNPLLTTANDSPLITPTDPLQTMPTYTPLTTTTDLPQTTPTGLIQTMPTDPLRTTPTSLIQTPSMDSRWSTSPNPLLTTPTFDEIKRQVISHIALDWQSVGRHLEVHPSVMKVIDDKYHDDVEKCCRTMFTRWLSHDEGTGGAPRLWRTVLKALKNVGYNTLVGDVERTLYEQN